MINSQYKSEKIDGLRQRIKTFILEVISFSRIIPKDDISKVILNQLLRASTSIGANFEESAEAESNQDVIHKLSIVRKEARETIYWLDLVSSCYPQLTTKISFLMQECSELVKILTSIISKRKSFTDD